MMAKEKVNYAKGGLTKAELKLNIYEPSGDYFMEKKGGKIILHLTSKDASNLPPSFFERYNVEDNGKGYYGTSYIVSKKYAKGGEVKKSEKYGSEYKKEDGKLLFRPINTKEEWSEVSDNAFNKEERKDFDTEISKIFKKGGSIEEVYLVQVEWKQLNDKGLGKFILTESDVERLEDDYGSTFYFEIYDDSDEKPISFTKMKNILDKAMAEKGLTESYFEKGGKTIDFKLDYLYNQLKISKNILDNSINNADKTINLTRYEAIQKAIDNILIKP